MCSLSLLREQCETRKTWRDPRHEPRTVAAALLGRVQQLKTVRAIDAAEKVKVKTEIEELEDEIQEMKKELQSELDN